MQQIKLINPSTFSNPLCAEIGTNFFYLTDRDDDTIKESEIVSTYEVAIKICKRCEHVTDCAEWAIKNERDGMWGGLTPQERTLIRRKRKITLLDSR